MKPTSNILFTMQQNTSRMELHRSSELLSVWGIMGHHNLQQIYLRDFGIELSHTVIPCCSGLRSAPYGSQIPLIPPHVFIIVACYIYNKNNGMVILWSSFFFLSGGTLHRIRLSMLIGQAIINGQSVNTITTKYQCSVNGSYGYYSQTRPWIWIVRYIGQCHTPLFFLFVMNL